MKGITSVIETLNARYMRLSEDPQVTEPNRIDTYSN